VGLILVFGVDYRSVSARYIGPACNSSCSTCRGACWLPFLVSMVMAVGLQLFLSRTFLGRAIQAVAQDQLALQLMAANPVKIKRIAFGLSIATASLAGACLIIIQPVEPSIGREYIGRIFAICVLGGLGSFPGMIIAADDPRHRGKPDLDLLRSLLGAGRGLWCSAGNAGRPAQRHPGSIGADAKTCAAVPLSWC
jgi:branched-chain amino acid transport system permease protein